MNYIGANNELFQVVDIEESNCDILKEVGENILSLLWFSSDDNKLTIDSVIFTTEFHKIEIKQVNTLKLLRFNKPFYCILDHDSEVGCKGILYYGSSTLPKITVTENDFEILKAVWKVLLMELESKDSLQLEMLQMMLKNFQAIDIPNSNIIREFNYLVEIHFKEKHSVVDYAELLHKSPKTLSNLFKKLENKTPLQFIQDRLILESKRLLKFSNKSVSEIGYDIGFNDVQSFSRFFKKQEGLSPLDFKQS